jgi:hypothetical protein
VNGWYRAHRGLAGNVRYTARRKGWDIWGHQLFPLSLRRAVRTMLLLNAQASNMTLEHRLNNMSIENENNHARPVHVTGPAYFHSTTSDYMPLDARDPNATAGLPPGVLLMSIPHDVVYYIMEFMVRF